jgi:hypothetical protein
LSETIRNGISARLWRLPRQFLLAFINATAILVIVAAILVLLTIARIDNFAGNVAARMTEAVLSRIELPAKDVLANLRNLREDVRTLGSTLREIKAGENPILQNEIMRLREALTTLEGSVDRLAEARTVLTDEAIGQLGRSVTNTLMSMRGCVPRAGQMGGHRRLGDAAQSRTPGLENGRGQRRAPAIDAARRMPPVKNVSHQASHFQAIENRHSTEL